jgi:DMSO/TMAO reductase YedYZ molybdopterin-dependent catalytic subunit
MDSTPTAPITGSRVVMDPATTTRILTPVSRLTSFVTPTEDVFVIAHMGIARVDAGAWRLAVDGLVTRALTLTYDDLRALPSRTVTSFIECYGNPVEPDVPTRRVGNVVWRGVALRDLLLRAGVSPRATHVWLEGADSGTFAKIHSDRYIKDLPLATVLERDDLLVAWEMNGAPLTAEHGFPARAVVPGFFGTNSVKWLTRVTLADTRPESLFTTKLYNRTVQREGVSVMEPVREADVHSLIVSPCDGDTVVRGGDVAIAGWAWSAWPVARVEVSVDGDAHWRDVPLEPRCEGHAWQRFVLDWRAETPGEYRIQCRATDARGRIQPPRYGRNRIHEVTITVE